MSDTKDDEDSKYFSMSDAAKEIGNSYGAAETAKAGAKLFAKGLFNLGRFAVTELPGEMVKTAERQKNKR